jgi:hypothetical protein
MSTEERRPKDYSKVDVQNFRNINNDDNGIFHRLSLQITSCITHYPCNGS